MRFISISGQVLKTLTIAAYSTRIVKFVIGQTGWFLLRVREVAAAHWCFNDPYVQAGE
jgi:hypothetical protein